MFEPHPFSLSDKWKSVKVGICWRKEIVLNSVKINSIWGTVEIF
jgi:hypothetical protein